MAERRMISTDIFECSIAWRLGEKYPGLLGIAAQRIIQMLIFLADDFGRGRYIPAMIRVRAFSSTPEVLEEITDKQIEEWVNIMVEEGMVEIYKSNEQKYYSLTGWLHYQRGNWRPKDSNIPAPPEDESENEPEDIKPAEKKKTKEKKKEKKPSTKKKAEKVPGLKAFIDWFYLEYERIIGTKPVYPQTEYMHLTNLYKKLIKNISEDEIKTVCTLFLEDTGDYTVGHIPSNLARNWTRFSEKAGNSRNKKPPPVSRFSNE